MKFLEKNLINIERNDKGEIVINSKNDNNNIDYSKVKVTNQKTGQVFEYADLCYAVGKDGKEYLAPAEFYNTNKIPSTYLVENWLFEGDSRLKDMKQQANFDLLLSMAKSLSKLTKNFGVLSNTFSQGAREFATELDEYIKMVDPGYNSSSEASTPDIKGVDDANPVRSFRVVNR